ncbi:unnamed protein product [Polarella glacialis]|uniref:Uncharacterized protein n=1 Tax=Polarella glacialis TaxID=89957 RepID=A0A813DPY2_POLGL|nr:unnamed protein product [Polarella glacialis]
MVACRCPGAALRAADALRRPPTTTDALRADALQASASWWRNAETYMARHRLVDLEIGLRVPGHALGSPRFCHKAEGNAKQCKTGAQGSASSIPRGHAPAVPTISPAMAAQSLPLGNFGDIHGTQFNRFVGTVVSFYAEKGWGLVKFLSGKCYTFRKEVAEGNIVLGEEAEFYLPKVGYPSVARLRMLSMPPPAPTAENNATDGVLDLGFRVCTASDASQSQHRSESTIAAPSSSSASALNAATTPAPSSLPRGSVQHAPVNVKVEDVDARPAARLLPRGFVQHARMKVKLENAAAGPAVSLLPRAFVQYAQAVPYAPVEVKVENVAARPAGSLLPRPPESVQHEPVEVKVEVEVEVEEEDEAARPSSSLLPHGVAGITAGASNRMRSAVNADSRWFGSDTTPGSDKSACTAELPAKAGSSNSGASDWYKELVQRQFFGVLESWDEKAGRGLISSRGCERMVNGGATLLREAVVGQSRNPLREGMLMCFRLKMEASPTSTGAAFCEMLKAPLADAVTVLPPGSFRAELGAEVVDLDAEPCFHPLSASLRFAGTLQDYSDDTGLGRVFGPSTWRFGRQGILFDRGELPGEPQIRNGLQIDFTVELDESGKPVARTCVLVPSPGPSFAASGSSNTPQASTPPPEVRKVAAEGCKEKEAKQQQQQQHSDCDRREDQYASAELSARMQTFNQARRVEDNAARPKKPDGTTTTATKTATTTTTTKKQPAAAWRWAEAGLDALAEAAGGRLTWRELKGIVVKRYRADNTLEQDVPVEELEMYALADLEAFANDQDEFFRAPSSSSKTNSSNNNKAKKPQLQGAAAWHWEQAALQALRAAGGQLPWRHLRRRLVAVYRTEVSMDAGLEDLPDKVLGIHALACLEEYASDCDVFFRLPMAQSPTRQFEKREASWADADGLSAKRHKSDFVVQTKGAGEKPPTGLPLPNWDVPRGGKQLQHVPRGLSRHQELIQHHQQQQQQLQQKAIEKGQCEPRALAPDGRRLQFPQPQSSQSWSAAARTYAAPGVSESEERARSPKRSYNPLFESLKHLTRPDVPQNQPPAADSAVGGGRVYVLDALNIMRSRNEDCPGVKPQLSWQQCTAAGKFYKDQKHQVFVFLPKLSADWSAHLEGVKRVLGPDCVVTTPAGVSDDKFMISFVKGSERSGSAARIVTNDKFRDHTDDARWIEAHTIKYAFAAGMFIPEDADK